MRRRPSGRSMTVLSLVGALLLPVPSAPAASSLVPVEVKRTTFVGSETKMIRVHFPEPVAKSDLIFDVHGDGRLFGFVMRKTGDYGDTTGPRQEALRPTVRGTAIGQCDTRGCEAHHGIVWVWIHNVRKAYAGTWELYLIADGAPVEVTLKIKGRDGEDVVDVAQTAGEPVRHEITTLTPRVHESATHTLYSAGEFSSLEEVDYGMVGLWAISARHLVTGMGPCVYYEGRPETPASFAPGCPGGDGATWTRHWTVPPSQAGKRGGMVYSLTTEDGPRGLGGWFTTAAQVKRYGAVALWIDYASGDAG